MIAKAIDRILELAAPVVVQVNGENYSTKSISRINFDLRAEPIAVKTLTGLLDYIKANNDSFNGWRGYFLHVADETTVLLRGELDNDRKRETIVRAEADLPKLYTNAFYQQEEFLIALQSCFIQDKDTDVAAVLKFAGTVKAGTITDYKDDGVSQKATVKTGVRTLAEAEVPSPAVLRPFRTFQEVEQPASKFIFRMKDGGSDGPKCALYEADGGAWKAEAMHNIKAYLTKELKKYGITIPVIA